MDEFFKAVKVTPYPPYWRRTVLEIWIDDTEDDMEDLTFLVRILRSRFKAVKAFYNPACQPDPATYRNDKETADAENQ